MKADPLFRTFSLQALKSMSDSDSSSDNNKLVDPSVKIDGLVNNKTPEDKKGKNNHHCHRFTDLFLQMSP